jgi:ABC-2 type transport system ATP-binding protein
MPAVEVDGLTVRYANAERPAVDGVDLVAESGQVLVVLGPNGAGKTSTVETLEGYRRRAAGRVRVLGLDPQSDHRSLSGRIGVMLQRGGVYPMLGPRRILDLFGHYYDEPVPTDELLELTKLGAVAATPWRHLSGGEQQRLSLALALVGRPEVAFLDEPTAGVDPEGRLAIRAVIASLRREGVCVVLTTHELTEAEKLADRIVIMASGRIVREGTPGQLTAASATPALSFGAVAGLDVESLAAAVGADTTVRETEPGRYRVEGVAVTGPGAAAAVTAWLAGRGVTLRDLSTGPSLEDVYLDAVGAPAAVEVEVAVAEVDPETTADRRRRGRRRSGR